MTQLLRKAFEEASKLPIDEQDALARSLLDELRSEERWSSAFNGTEESLVQLADEALSEYRAGKTEPLDPDRL